MAPVAQHILWRPTRHTCRLSQYVQNAPLIPQDICIFFDTGTNRSCRDKCKNGKSVSRILKKLAEAEGEALTFPFNNSLNRLDVLFPSQLAFNESSVSLFHFRRKNEALQANATPSIVDGCLPTHAFFVSDFGSRWFVHILPPGRQRCAYILDALRSNNRSLDKTMSLEGVLPIVAAKGLMASIGVSGAPGGDKETVCAQAGIDHIAKILAFAILLQNVSAQMASCRSIRSVPVRAGARRRLRCYCDDSSKFRQLCRGIEGIALAKHCSLERGLPI